jgi:hypothetical protein
MYTFPPSAEEMEGAGFSPEDYEDDPVPIWPDTREAFDLFLFMETQWRRDNGPCGLDYNVLFHKMDRMNLSVDQYDELEGDIRVMETAALGAIRKSQQRK